MIHGTSLRSATIVGVALLSVSGCAAGAPARNERLQARTVSGKPNRDQPHRERDCDHGQDLA